MSEKRAGLLGSARRQNELFLGRLARPAAPLVNLHSELYLKGKKQLFFNEILHEILIVGEVSKEDMKKRNYFYQ